MHNFMLSVLHPMFTRARLHSHTSYVKFIHNTNQLQLSVLVTVFLVDVTAALLLPFAVAFSVKQHRAFVSLEQLLIGKSCSSCISLETGNHQSRLYYALSVSPADRFNS